MLPEVHLETTKRGHLTPLGWLRTKDQKASVVSTWGKWNLVHHGGGWGM